MERWSGKIAVVTGASSGIGYAIAEELAKKGLIVVGLARREELMKKLTEKYKGKVYAIKCDLAKEEDIISAFKWIEKKLGGVDLLVNNAGTATMETISEGTTEVWRKTLDVNVLGLSISTREALKTMKKRGDNGHIININSICGHWAPPSLLSLSMYSASKFATRSLAESLKLELATRKSMIKVTNICPGLVDTDMSRDGFKYRNIDIPPMCETALLGFLSAQDIADVVIDVISMKPHVQIEELIVIPMGDPY